MADAGAGSAEHSMTLVDACVPSLPGGRYAITVGQTLTHQGKEIKSKQPRDREDTKPTFGKPPSVFWVAGPRFTLPSSDIYAMYPSPDARGTFADALPHVVLKRRTLPWERSLLVPKDARADARPRPWMALLLLDEDDLGMHAPVPLKPETRTLTEVLGPRPSREPLAPWQPWERADDRCTALDIPAALFGAIAPTWDDLPYLAHARRVGSTAHRDADGIDDEGWFSVVVANRTPTPDKEHGVYLVSLEGLERWLPRAGAPLPADRPDFIRVVVLASWRFADDTRSKSIRDLAAGLTCGALRLPARTIPARATPATDPDPVTLIPIALDSGYAPLDHQTRQGHRTVSWYRGPLVPLFLPTLPHNIIYSCADAALRYDRYSGFLDVSYAAAWELGRLLALRNPAFVAAIHRLKLRTIQAAADAAARADLAARFGGAPADDWTAIATRFLQSNPPKEATSSAGPRPRAAAAARDPYETLHEAIGKQAAAVQIPLEVRQFLGRLFLLHGVPLGYLVAHPEMVPPESLRTFYLDTSWLGALLDGALGVGRVSDSLLFLDKAMTGRFLGDVARDEAKTGTVDVDLGEPGSPDIKQVIGHLTGFLLRSKLVSGWRGIEVKADVDGAGHVLRLERVAKDTLLGIYAGQLRRLVITQPAQGLHFEVTGAPRRPASRAIDVRALARDRDPAQLAADLLARRVQRAIDVTIAPERAGAP